MQTVLSPSPPSVRHARRFVSECLGDADDASEVAVLLTSELVTNAIQHGGPHSPSASVRLPVQDLVGGRGLLLVERLADRWGCERLNGGNKVVWFELVTSPTATSKVDGDDG